MVEYYPLQTRKSIWKHFGSTLTSATQNWIQWKMVIDFSPLWWKWDPIEKEGQSQILKIIKSNKFTEPVSFGFCQHTHWIVRKQGKTCSLNQLVQRFTNKQTNNQTNVKPVNRNNLWHGTHCRSCRQNMKCKTLQCDKWNRWLSQNTKDERLWRITLHRESRSNLCLFCEKNVWRHLYYKAK